MTPRVEHAPRRAPADLRARLVIVGEAIEDGDTALAAEIVRDLLGEIGVERGRARCRWCGLTGWGGIIEKHERIVHARELLDDEVVP